MYIFCVVGWGDGMYSWDDGVVGWDVFGGMVCGGRVWMRWLDGVVWWKGWIGCKDGNITFHTPGRSWSRSYRSYGSYRSYTIYRYTDHTDHILRSRSYRSYGSYRSYRSSKVDFGLHHVDHIYAYVPF